MSLIGGVFKFATSTLHGVEVATLRFLVDRMQAADPRLLALPASAPAARTESPSQTWSRLLDRSLSSTTSTGRADHHALLLRQLVPDEARIVDHLATAEPSPVVTIQRRGSGETVLANASLVGRSAAVTLPSQTPTYVNHLLQLGLVQLGPEDPDNGAGYELVLAERQVRAALREGAAGKVPAKVVRRTVRLSDLGTELWESVR